jgi:hypothetical protein
LREAGVIGVRAGQITEYFVCVQWLVAIGRGITDECRLGLRECLFRTLLANVIRRATIGWTEEESQAKRYCYEESQQQGGTPLFVAPWLSPATARRGIPGH